MFGRNGKDVLEAKAEEFRQSPADCFSESILLTTRKMGFLRPPEETGKLLIRSRDGGSAIDHEEDERCALDGNLSLLENL